jgi:hypothetical protein
MAAATAKQRLKNPFCLAIIPFSPLMDTAFKIIPVRTCSLATGDRYGLVRRIEKRIGFIYGLF